MFDLEKAIAEWNKSLRRANAVQDGDRAELEGYLRDKIEDLVDLGLSEEEAFRRAADTFDRAAELDEEYHKARGKGRPSWKAPRRLPGLAWSYGKIAGRKILRQKGYSALTIGSLALAMAVGLLILLWAQYEKSYDRFHAGADSIHRVLYQVTRATGLIVTESSVPVALPFVIKDLFPEVQAASRLWKQPAGTRFESPTLVENRSTIVFADPDFLSMFDFPLLRGDPRTALAHPKSIVLTETAARRFFGAADPLGKFLLALDSRIPLQVTGVLKDIPETSHLDFDMLVSAADLSLWSDDQLKSDDWFHIFWSLYIRIAPGADPRALEAKLSRLAAGKNPNIKARLLLQPLTEIHLRSEHVVSTRLSDRRRDAVNERQIRTFLLVSLVVLLIGCINYVNLAVARALKRAKEIGIRKANGAARVQIFGQFLGESLALALAALAAALVLAFCIGLPVLRRLTGLLLDLDLVHKGRLLLKFLALALATGTVAGFYPAVFVSSFSPIQALKERFAPGGTSFLKLRRILVALQIVCSAALIGVISVLILQLRYVDRKDLGFKRDSLVVVQNDIAAERWAEYKNELLAHPAIRGAATGFLPAMGEGGHFIQGKEISWEGKAPDTVVNMDWHFVDEDYQKTFGLTMAQGRFFSKDFPTDKDNYVLNESAVRAMGLQDPIGKMFKVRNKSGRIIGVVRDFHVASLKAKIRPMYFLYLSGYFATTLQIDPRNTAAAIRHIAAVVEKFAPGTPLRYRFLDEYLRRMYDGDRRNARIISALGVVSILLSCLGLFGLISFTAEQRTKEIGIRKVLGASVSRIVGMLAAEFAGLIGAAVIAAAPIGYFLSRRWLDTFAYHMDLKLWIFAGAGVLVLALTFLAMSLRAIRAARANPVESLRFE